MTEKVSTRAIDITLGGRKNAPNSNLIPKVSKTEQIEPDAGAILDRRVDLLFDEGGYPPSTRAYRPRRCPSPGLVF
jgi:hypothetical protein